MANIAQLTMDLRQHSFRLGLGLHDNNYNVVKSCLDAATWRLAIADKVISEQTYMLSNNLKLKRLAIEVSKFRWLAWIGYHMLIGKGEPVKNLVREIENSKLKGGDQLSTGGK